MENSPNDNWKLKTSDGAVKVAEPKKSAEEKKVLAGLAWAPFKESSNNQLLPIRQLELFRTKTKLQADESMAADEKKAKMAEIDAQLAALEKQMATN